MLKCIQHFLNPNYFHIHTYHRFLNYIRCQPGLDYYIASSKCMRIFNFELNYDRYYRIIGQNEKGQIFGVVLSPNGQIITRTYHNNKPVPISKKLHHLIHDVYRPISLIPE